MNLHILTDSRTGFRLFHLHVHSIVLPQDSPEPAGARHSQRDGGNAAARNTWTQLDLGGVDAGQDTDGAALGLLLCRAGPFSFNDPISNNKLHLNADSRRK